MEDQRKPLHVHKQTEYDFLLSVIVAQCSVHDESLTYGHYDCASRNALYQKNFEVYQACSSDEDDFNTIHNYLEKADIIRWMYAA